MPLPHNWQSPDVEDTSRMLSWLREIESGVSLLANSVSVRDPQFVGGAKGDGVTDDSAAIQAALNVGGTVVVPPGTYSLGTAVSISTANTRLVGFGNSTTIIKRAAAIGTPITVSADSCSLEDLAVDGGLSSFATNANHGISAQNVNHFRARHLLITNYQNSAILINGTTSRTYADNVIEFCRCDGGTSANNGFLIVNCDRSGIRGCRAENIQGASGPAYGCQIKNDSRWCFIDDCDAYLCTGGLVFGFDAATANGVIASRITGGSAVSCDGGLIMGAASNNVVSGVDIWMTTNVNDSIRLQGKGDGTNGSTNNAISSINVHGTGSSRSVVRFDDVSTDNLVELGLVDAGASATSSFTGTSDRNMVVVKKYGTSTPTHEASHSSTGTQNRVRRVEDRPSLYATTLGGITQSMDRGAPTAALAMTSQLPYYIPIYLFAGEVVSSVTFHVSSLSVAPTNFYVGLYTSGLVQKAVSADAAASVTGTGQKTISFGTPYTVLDSGVYYVGLLNNGGTLSPLGLAGSTAARIGSNPYPYAQDTSTTSTTLPSTGAIAAGTKAFWVMLT